MLRLVADVGGGASGAQDVEPVADLDGPSLLYPGGGCAGIRRDRQERDSLVGQDTPVGRVEPSTGGAHPRVGVTEFGHPRCCEPAKRGRPRSDDGGAVSGNDLIPVQTSELKRRVGIGDLIGDPLRSLRWSRRGRWCDGGLRAPGKSVQRIQREEQIFCRLGERCQPPGRPIPGQPRTRTVRL